MLSDLNISLTQKINTEQAGKGSSIGFVLQVVILASFARLSNRPQQVQSYNTASVYLLFKLIFTRQPWTSLQILLHHLCHHPKSNFFLLEMTKVSKAPDISLFGDHLGL